MISAMDKCKGGETWRVNVYIVMKGLDQITVE